MATLTWDPNINSSNPYMKLTVSQSSQSVSSNYSTLSYSLILYRPYYISSSASKSYNVKINGSTVASGSTTIGGSGTKTIASGTTKVYHNSDGTKKNVPISFYCDFGITWSGTGTGNASASGDIDLDTIPRASSISSFPNFTIGNSFTVKIDRKSSSFTHTLKLYAGGTYIGSWGGIGTSKSISLTSTQQNNIYKTIPSSTSRTMTMRVYTYSGSTQIGSYKTATATAYVSSSIKPTIGSIGHSEYVSDVASKIGEYVQTLSRLSLSINNASGAKYSTIKSYKLSFDGSSWSSRTATSGYVKGSGSLTITGTVTDSRGRSASKSVTVTVLAYSPPKFTNLTVDRCDSSGNLVDDGTYAKLYRTGSISSLNSKNQFSIKTYSRPRDSSTWKLEYEGTASVGDTSMSTTKIHSGFDILYSFDFRVEFSDLFNTIIATKTISTGAVTMSWGKDGVGIGKVWEQGTLDVGGSIFAQKMYLGDGNTSDGEELLRFQMERYWSFYQVGTGSSACLALRPHSDNKEFNIQNLNGDRIATFAATETAPYMRVPRLVIENSLDGDFYFNKTTYKTMGNIVAESYHPDSWNDDGNSSLKLQNHNNALSIIVGGVKNDRNALIQVGHAHNKYSHVKGTLWLNRLGGNVALSDRGYTILVNGSFASLANWADQIGGQNRNWHIYIENTSSPRTQIGWTNPSGERTVTTLANWSKRELKKEIREYDYELAYEQIQNMPIYSYKLKSVENDENLNPNERKLGIMLDEAPFEVQDSANDKPSIIDTYGLTSLSIAGLKATQKRVEELEALVYELQNDIIELQGGVA